MLAHKGIVRAARATLDARAALLEEALAANPGYKLVLTGHSLGAGTAIIITLLLHVARGAIVPSGLFKL